MKRKTFIDAIDELAQAERELIRAFFAPLLALVPSPIRWLWRHFRKIHIF